MEYFLFLADVNPYFLGFFVFVFFPHLTDVPSPSDLWLLGSLQCLILELLCPPFLGNLCGSCCFIYLLFANWHFEAWLRGLNVWVQLEFNAPQSELFISFLLSPWGQPLLAIPLSESNSVRHPTVEASHRSNILGSSFPLISHSQSPQYPVLKGLLSHPHPSISLVFSATTRVQSSDIFHWTPSLSPDLSLLLYSPLQSARGSSQSSLLKHKCHSSTWNPPLASHGT